MTVYTNGNATSLRIVISGLGNAGLNAVSGTIKFQPTQRLNVNDSFMALPVPFEVVIDPLEEETTVILLSNNEDWCWKITERLPNGKVFYTNIPDTESVEYFDLVELDPETLTQPAQIAAWSELSDRVDNAEVNIANLEVSVAALEAVGDGEEVSFAVVGGTSGTQPTFTGAPLFSGSYVQVGSIVHFRINVDFSNITSFGTGQYFLQLPFASKYGVQFRDGCLHDATPEHNYHISGHTLANSNVMTLWTTDVQGSIVRDYVFSQGSPITLTTADIFHISGQYIKA
jgi:hypothetical protein